MAGTPFERHAIKELDLEIPSGSFVSILGQTGSGKSTLIQLIAGLLEPTSGTIQVGPYTLKQGGKQSADVRKHVGIVFQYPEHQLFEETVAKDIAFGPRNQGLTEKEIKKRVEMALEWVGLPSSFADRSPFQLSGGQMRRVALAGVLALAPDILILDEPTAGLDPQGKMDLLTLIHRLHRDQNMTVILVTHDMNEAAKYADYLFVLADGTCRLHGSPSEVFQKQKQLTALALDLPEITRLIHQLNQKVHPPIPTDLFTIDQLESYLLERLRKVENV
ncbi:energy-coupling factor transport system ATP-binding protein [Thermoflavimicrobium dichotomicum]|uniref:Energy-coupling factor transporter ATP-binding protein EcfA2 n=2 Tax=Thermoflavimicrobium dichotomicum TaxID=46223 RepID=A0A1I3QX00_9BACL|nr:energy-coupling factor transport system ATP-binding protein [Thermoflavimicrobium dichotomicum]